MRINWVCSYESGLVDVEFMKYPDGQQDCKNLEFINFSGEYHNCVVYITQSITSFNDIGKIMCVRKYLDNFGVKNIILRAPYIMGLRSDRQFVQNGVRYIADILAPVLNSMNFSRIISYDPHSYVAENCINNFVSVSRADILRDFILKLPFDILNTYLISPDAGAFAKSKEINIAYKFKDILIASKKRNSDGTITTYLPTDFDKTLDVFITDDICDGGGTFLGLRQALRDCGHIGKVYIFTTHAMFSKGMKAVLPHFDHMWTTDSFPFIADEGFPGKISDKLTIIEI